MKANRSRELRVGIRNSRGFNLIELMVSLILGLLVVGAAVSIFISNQQTYVATENLGRVQENARVAFELMSRDIREAGGNVCDRGLNTVNVLNNPTANWWSSSAGIRGYAGNVAFTGAPVGTATGQRVAGTEAIELTTASDGSVTITDHNPTSAQFKVNTTGHTIQDGDIVAVCDFDHIAITQITNAQPGINDTIVHNTGTGTPGNCTKGLGIPLLCTANGTPYTFGPNSRIARLEPRIWYIGNSSLGAGRRALFQTVLINTGGTLSTRNQEIALDVQTMTVEYLVAGANAYVGPAAVADWTQVLAAKVQLVIASPDRIGTDGQPLQRTLEHVITLRNRAL